ncbi:Plasmodium vivax Vir protein, putative [Plasmodium vivax]|uniref:Vir protein, putative n=1 Tax=Plasmodium vivax TaxID=5855 RepID=A0A1G4E629_PLAVI|nr:Plasmodium vivax Vir protein, putative [Plasmodium vivax]
MALSTTEFSNFPKDIVTYEIQKRDDVIKNCIILKNYLLDFKNNDLCDDNKCCEYFNFWLNEGARKVKPINKITLSYYENCIKSYINLNKCISEIYYINDSEFDKKQELYNLYDLYDFYNDFKLITVDPIKCTFYNNCAFQYNNIIGKCKNAEDDDFCKELKNFGNKFLKNILTPNEHCEEKIIELLSPEDATVRQVEAEEDEEDEEQPPPPQEEEQTVKASQGQVGLGNVAVVEANLEAGESGGMPSARAEAGKIPDHRDSENLVEHHNSNIPKSMGTIIGTSFGFFIPLTMLYKFTPLGSWINTKVLGRDKLMDNMKKNELEYILNNAQTQDINTGDTIYRIKYNSALNE